MVVHRLEQFLKMRAIGRGYCSMNGCLYSIYKATTRGYCVIIMMRRFGD